MSDKIEFKIGDKDWAASMQKEILNLIPKIADITFVKEILENFPRKLTSEEAKELREIIHKQTKSSQRSLWISRCYSCQIFNNAFPEKANLRNNNEKWMCPETKRNIGLHSGYTLYRKCKKYKSVDEKI